jgi:hypothetical protein
MAMCEILALWNRNSPPIEQSNGSKSTRPKRAQNWFDADVEIEDLKSEQSNESLYADLDKEKGDIRERGWEQLGAAAEVSVGSMPVHGSGNGILVTRQVIVETSRR